MSEPSSDLRCERNHWIGEAKRYERLYRARDEKASLWFKRMKVAEAQVERARALLAEWDAWDGSTEGFGTSPRVRDALRAALESDS